MSPDTLAGRACLSPTEACASENTGLRHELPRHELTIVAPVYGNSKSLERLVERIHTALDAETSDHIILLVNDASPDDAWRVIGHLCKCDRRLAAINLERNSGQHRAIMAGLALTRGRWVAVMDADLQDPPEALPALLAKAKSTQGTVFGERVGLHQSRSRSIGSSVYKGLLSVLAGVPRRCGTFLVMPRDVADRLTQYDVSHPQVLVMTCKASPRFSTMPFTRNTRESGTTTYDVRRLLTAARHGVQCALECRRGLQAGRAVLRTWAPISEFAGRAWQSDTR